MKVRISATAALTYVEDELVSARGIGNAILHELPREGEVFAFVNEADRHLAEGYAELALSSPDAEIYAVEEVATFIQTCFSTRERDGFALLTQFPDAPRQRRDAADPRAQSFRSAWLTDPDREDRAGEIWYSNWKTPAAADAELLSEALWYPGVVLLVPNGPELDNAISPDISIEALRLMTKDAVAVFVAGWDAMSYLVWLPATGSAGRNTPQI